MILWYVLQELQLDTIVELVYTIHSKNKFAIDLEQDNTIILYRSYFRSNKIIEILLKIIREYSKIQKIQGLMN